MFICYLTKNLLNDVNEIDVTIKKWRLLFIAKILLDFNGYLSLNEHFSTTAVPHMLRGTRHFFLYGIIYIHCFTNIVKNFIIFIHLYKIFNVLATKWYKYHFCTTEINGVNQKLWTVVISRCITNIVRRYTRLYRFLAVWQ